MDPRRARSFGAAAGAYDRGRPSYPADALRWVLPAQAAHVLDLGAGTGKLTAALQLLGLDVVAVEPDDAMRAVIPARSLQGTAESIPLPDASVDAVLVGQAFHWFDPALAVPEMVRVLRPGGSIGLLWNVFDDAVPWVAELVEIWDAEDRASYARAVDDPPYDGARFGLTQPERRLVPHEQQADRELLADNVASRSHVLLMDHDAREQLLQQVRAAAPADQFPIPYVCATWRSRLEPVG